MRSGLGEMEKSIKSRLELMADLENRNFLDEELRQLERLTQKQEKQENLEEVGANRRSKRTIT